MALLRVIDGRLRWGAGHSSARPRRGKDAPTPAFAGLPLCLCCPRWLLSAAGSRVPDCGLVEGWSGELEAFPGVTQSRSASVHGAGDGGTPDPNTAAVQMQSAFLASLGGQGQTPGVFRF